MFMTRTCLMTYICYYFLKYFSCLSHYFLQAEFRFRPAQEKNFLSRWHFALLYYKVLLWSQHTIDQARPTRMSQLQYHCPASPIPAASAQMPLGQPQPGYSIPCASGTLPSESAGQPIRSSALPAGSATAYSTTTGFIHLIVFRA